MQHLDKIQIFSRLALFHQENKKPKNIDNNKTLFEEQSKLKKSQ